jgi:hypothetical protein
MKIPAGFALNILQGLWAFWPLIFFAVIAGWRGRGNKKVVDVLKRINRNLLVGWLLFFVLWVILAIVQRPPASYIIPETLNYSLFWMIGVVLIGLQAFFFILNRFQTAEAVSEEISLVDLLVLTPNEFEQLVADTYRAVGYSVQIEKAHREKGFDLVLESSEGVKSVVQCKQWRGFVDEPVVRAFYGAMQFERVVEGAIITTGTFTQQARDWARDKSIHLYGGEEFLKVLRRSQGVRKPISLGV